MITSIPPKVIADGAYNTTETSNLLGVHRDTLNRYVKQGRIHCLYSLSEGRKFFEGREISRFWHNRLL